MNKDNVVFTFSGWGGDLDCCMYYDVVFHEDFGEFKAGVIYDCIPVTDTPGGVYLMEEYDGTLGISHYVALSVIPDEE